MSGLRMLTLLFLFCLPLWPGGNACAASLPVVVSIAPQKYLVERIGGKAVSVSVLVTPGADPHSYEPTPGQMKNCAEASLYFTIGVPFEDIWLPRIGGAAKNLKIISMIKGIRRLPSTNGDGDARDGAHSHDGHAHGGEDPHVWLSPMLVRSMLPGIARELGKALPEQAAVFRSNAEKLSAELEALDMELANQFNSVPQNKRVFLTFHPAWQYFARNYALTELSIEVNGKEPGPKTMKAVIDTARTYGLTAVFVEPQFPRAMAQAIAANIDAKAEQLDPLAEDLPANLRHVADALIDSFTRNKNR